MIAFYQGVQNMADILQNPRVAIYTMQHLEELFDPAAYSAWIMRAKMQAVHDDEPFIHMSGAGDPFIHDQDAFTAYLGTYKAN